MKIEQKQGYSGRLERIRNILKTLLFIEDCEKLKETIRSYTQGDANYPIRRVPKTIAKKHYYYFYEELERNYLGEKIGKLSKDLYQENKNKIEVLRLLCLKSELKELIEQINKRSQY